MDDAELVTIGRFARLTGLSTGTLRHYDEVGLLTPASVDPASGYRRYRRDQAGRARQIAMLRWDGLPMQCSISGQAVTCTTPGPLAAGQSLPPIAVTVQTAAMQLNPTAQVSTDDDAGQPGETSPPVSVQVTPVGSSK